MEMDRANVAIHGSADRARQVLFVVAILSSAFLIFLVQPMVGKRILPWFGGSPGVWTLCLAFYQTTLFVGYAYAYLLIRFAAPGLQLGIHAALVCVALFVLPVLPDESWKPAGMGSPSSTIFLMLASNVALPFVVLASTGPLVQVWFARRFPERSPYPLYAVSNVGSFAALLAYPFLLEPRLTLSLSGSLWSYAFALTTVAVLGCAALARGRGVVQEGRGDTESGADGSRDPTLGQITLWFLLSGCAVILLMGVTNSICLDIASVPFLWILPLATYLLTFVLCFSSEKAYHPASYVVMTLVAFLPTVGMPLLEESSIWTPSVLAKSVYVQIPAYCALVFGGCMIMHGELYRLRPPTRALTAFYLCVAGGGALGGLFVGLLAPFLFEGYYEVRVGLGLAALLFLAASTLRARDRSGTRAWRWLAAGPLAFALIAGLVWPKSNLEGDKMVHQARNFFGVLRVSDRVGPRRSIQRFLYSGSTMHGLQFRGNKRAPSIYYGKATGLGLLFAHRNDEDPLRVGAIGLGIGTLAAYGRDRDFYRFYEIDPAVVWIARDSGHFTFIEDSAARVEIVVGDARLAIADEQKLNGSQQYDILVLDAFSSGAIPVHLLTVEAFRLYAQALAPGGILAVHVSNRHFHLLPPVARLGFEVGMKSLYMYNNNAPKQRSMVSQWAFLSNDPQRLREFSEFAREHIPSLGLPTSHLRILQPREAEVRRLPLWSDDYCDLLGALK